VKVITIASDLENEWFRRYLVPSSHAAGIELHVLHPPKGKFRFTDKRVITRKFLAGVDPDELVVFTDAYDTVFLRGEQFIEETYARFGRRVVFGAELNSWPLAVVGLALQQGPPAGPFPYLNSGGFIGPAGDLLDLYLRYPEPPSDRFELLRHLRTHGYDVDRRCGFSDQYHWTLISLLERDLVELDHDAQLFEYYGPPMPDVQDPKVVRDFEEFRERGRDAEVYQREYARLRNRLEPPSGAAQVHFASYITKAVVLDLLAERALPGWLEEAFSPPPSAGKHVQVHEV
jgi:hypothetical protein